MTKINPIQCLSTFQLDIIDKYLDYDLYFQWIAYETQAREIEKIFCLSIQDLEDNIDFLEQDEESNIRLINIIKKIISILRKYNCTMLLNFNS